MGITGLDSEDFDILDSSAEVIAFKVETKTGMRNAVRDSDSNFNDANGNSDPDTWPVFINQMIQDKAKGKIGLDVEIEIHYTVKDKVIANQKGGTGKFGSNMATF